MSRHLSFAIALASTACAANAARAQRDSASSTMSDSSGRSLACAAAGTTVRMWGPGVTPSARRTSLDTTIVLAIADRSWTRTDVEAGVALGVSGTGGANASPWRACAGASAHLGTVTASLHQVHGTIRLHADPGALGSRANASGDSSGRTPPAVPPRR